FGKRVASAKGVPGTAAFDALFTLDDLFEVHFSGAGQFTGERDHLRVGGKLVGDVLPDASGDARATFYLQDNVGSVVAEAASDTGTVTVRQRRDPFGNALADGSKPFLPSD